MTRRPQTPGRGPRTEEAKEAPAERKAMFSHHEIVSQMAKSTENQRAEPHGGAPRTVPLSEAPGHVPGAHGTDVLAPAPGAARPGRVHGLFQGPALPLPSQTHQPGVPTRPHGAPAPQGCAPWEGEHTRRGRRRYRMEGTGSGLGGGREGLVDKGASHFAGTPRPKRRGVQVEVTARGLSGRESRRFPAHRRTWYLDGGL